MKKQVLIFCHGFATQFIEINNQYTKLFDPTHYDVTVAYLVGKEEDAIRKKHAASNVIFFDYPKKSIRGLKIGAIRQLLSLHRTKSFDIVICHRYKPTYIMLWVSLFKRIPLLISVMHELNTMKPFFRKYVTALLAKNQCYFAGVSNAVRDDLRQSIRGIPKEHILTLYNSIDLDVILPALLSKENARAFLQLPQNAFIFGTLGRLVPNKDQKTLIQAFQTIAKENPNSLLVILGDGPLEEALKKQADSLGIKEQVIFKGFIPNGSRAMKAFDVFVLPSIQEAFGMVLIEAMSAKVPIIAAKSHGIPEVMGETGFLVEKNNPQQLESIMIKMKTSPSDDLIRIGEKGFNRVNQIFSLAQFKKIFWEFFSKKDFT